MSHRNKYTCNEYRQEMILLSLRLRLNKPEVTEAEKEVILNEISKIETTMKMN
ncbi:MAG: hypothetical protein M0Z56_05955 [Desulfobacteraceae bacterium]|nr:hypothetical protein [Desulfobacteraceae bacterium]